MGRFMVAAVTSAGLYAGRYWWWFAVSLVAWVVVYAGSCWLDPWAPCLCCGRSESPGKHKRKDKKVWHRCRWCKGTGERLRVGRKVWNRYKRARA